MMAYVRQRRGERIPRVRTPPLGDQYTYLPDRPGRGEKVAVAEPAENRMRQVVPQPDQRGDQPVDEDQLASGVWLMKSTRPDRVRATSTGEFKW